MADDLSDFENLVLLVERDFADDSVEFGVFRESVDALQSDRRVCFMPTQFSSEPAQRANVGMGTDDVLCVDFLTVEVDIRGASFADACDIRYRIMNSLRNVFRANSEPLDGVYPSQVTSKPSVEWDGQGRILQRFRWRMNVPKLERTYIRKVTEIDIVDRTQITTTVDGVLTPDDQLSIKE